MGMKQILAMMAAAVNLSVMADEVVFKERAIGDALAEQLKKPAGKFLPPPQFTKTELEKITGRYRLRQYHRCGPRVGQVTGTQIPCAVWQQNHRRGTKGVGHAAGTRIT